MRRIAGFLLTGFVAWPLIVWLQPPWYATMSMVPAAGMLVECYLATFWPRP